jgi:hypothetical protein
MNKVEANQKEDIIEVMEERRRVKRLLKRKVTKEIEEIESMFPLDLSSSNARVQTRN